MKKKQRIKEIESLWKLFQKENPNSLMTWRLFKFAVKVNGGIEKSKKMIESQ